MIGSHIRTALINTYFTVNVSPPGDLYLQFLPKLNHNSLRSLITPHNLLEIKKALWNNHPYKTPWDDGLHTAFYQKKIGTLLMKKSLMNFKISFKLDSYQIPGVKLLFALSQK